MGWHLAFDRRHPRKANVMVRDYFVRNMGLGNEVSGHIEKAKVFRTKREADAARKEYCCRHMKPVKAASADA